MRAGLGDQKAFEKALGRCFDIRPRGFRNLVNAGPKLSVLDPY